MWHVNNVIPIINLQVYPLRVRAVMATLFSMPACLVLIVQVAIPRTIGLQDITDHTRALQMKVAEESIMAVHPAVNAIHKRYKLRLVSRAITVITRMMTINE